MVNPYEIILMPWITEKSMESRSRDNRLEFVVRRSATKGDIAAALEILFDAELSVWKG